MHIINIFHLDAIWQNDGPLILLEGPAWGDMCFFLKHPLVSFEIDLKLHISGHGMLNYNVR